MNEVSFGVGMVDSRVLCYRDYLGVYLPPSVIHNVLHMRGFIHVPQQLSPPPWRLTRAIGGAAPYLDCL